MWTYQGLRVREGRSWANSDGVQHPSNWNIWTNDQKIAAGLAWVDDPVVSAPVIDLATQKANAIATVKAKARDLLEETDWQVVKATEVADYSVPSNVTTYRAAVRTASNTIESAINGAADQAAFNALSETPVDENGDPTGNAPIDDWPEEI
jgi:hypothetical protein